MTDIDFLIRKAASARLTATAASAASKKAREAADAAWEAERAAQAELAALIEEKVEVEAVAALRG